MGGLKGNPMTQATLPTDMQQPAPPKKNGAAPVEPAPVDRDGVVLEGDAQQQAIVRAADEPGRAISAFSDQKNFEAGQRIARALASSSLVPKEYQQNIPNVLIAMELANRIGASVFMVMQSLDVIHGRPSWRAQFLIGTVNASGRFTPLRFRYVGKESTDDWGCRAVAKDRESGEECVGALITMRMAKEEGWSTKSGSKWKTMPEQMLMYRAASFWTRVYCPELALGMQTREEVIDTFGEAVRGDHDMPDDIAPGSPKALEAALLSKGKPEETDRQPGDD
jgi:hypothetical protein